MDRKKLLVFSDTHGCLNVLIKVLKWARNHLPPNDTICCAAFLGDGISDLRMAAETSGFFCDWKVVNGNNDYDHSLPEAAVFDFADHRFLICHGHRHSLYGGYHTMISSARSANADVVLFGHTHVPFHKAISGIQLINPGSVGRPRSRIGSTFAVIECVEGEQIKVEFLGFDTHGEIHKVKV